MNAVTINATQRVFVIPGGGGFSCLGFDVVFKRLAQYAKRLGLGQPNAASIGQLEQYQDYLKAERAYIATNPQDTQFDPDTPVAVQAYLEAYRKTGAKVRLFLGNPETGKDWLSEWDAVGRVSRSMGPLKVPLLVTPGEDGGGAILTACVLRIIDVASKREVYRHANYKEPIFEVTPSKEPGFTVDVSVYGSVHARFKSDAKAKDWVDFMTGRRVSNVSRGN